MKKLQLRIIAAPLLLGCALFVSGLVSAEELITCSNSPKAAKGKSGIAISTADEAASAYKITNTGSVKLTNVRVTDDHVAAISCQQDALDVGESMGCAAAANTGCAVADHVEFSEAGVTVTTKGDCLAGRD
jgi:hypothetical protein